MPKGPPKRLVQGYKEFRRDRYPVLADRYRQLADGQRPRTLVLACADSRVDPATIFTAAPGELFVVRNVANLVPPPESEGVYHGTSAALEFAIDQLEVEDVVIMGHARCGGLTACLHAHERPVGHYIAPWVELAAPARDEVLAAHPDADPDTHLVTLEHTAIRHSLRHLAAFPFVAERLAAGTVSLHGAWFSVAEGELHWLEPDSGEDWYRETDT